MKNLSKLYLVSPVLFGTILGMGEIASAQSNPSLEQLFKYSNEGYQEDVLDQVTNVNQLRDVSPGDWAFEALRNLVERYGCIAGYPSGVYLGNRAMTRYEFAAGLNACLGQIERLIASSTADFITRDDLATLEQLVSQFEGELATLGTRVDDLEGRVASLEDNQFSTTTKLVGEVIFALSDIFDGEGPNGDADYETTFSDRVRIELETSFSGQDLLFTRLSAGNTDGIAGVTGTPEGDFSFGQNDGNNVGLEVLNYRFPLGDNSEVVVFVAGGATDDFAGTVNFLDGDGGSGAISAFGTRNPIYYPFEEAGIGFNTQLSDYFNISIGYGSSTASDPGTDAGLFNGDYSAFGQIVFTPSDTLALGLTYLHGYNQINTGTGSNRSNARDFISSLSVGGVSVSGVPVSSNSYGVELSWQLSEKFVLGGWAGYTQATTLDAVAGLPDRGSLDIWNWAVTLAFPDLGKEGNLGGIIVGMEPRVTDSSIDIPATTTTPDNRNSFEDDDTSLHIEGFYQFQINDNIAITPGIIYITAPDHDDSNDPLIIGTIRTTFSF